MRSRGGKENGNRELPHGSEILLVRGIGDTYHSLVRLEENKYADVTLNNNQVEVNELCNHFLAIRTSSATPLPRQWK
ncbi:hypothetical protein M1N79_04825 [Dehalococcoidia bacterium]|nr:hypothetical protein [Dehalococcoidia bacterium]